jgi:AraC-like DNA-binding protein
MSVKRIRRVEEAPSAFVEAPGIRVERGEKDLERPSQGGRNVPFLVESMGATEQRMSFRVGDSWCRFSTMELPSGVRLGVTASEFEPSFSFSVVQPPSELEFVISKGAVLQARTTYGHDLRRGGNQLQLGQAKCPVPMLIRPAGEARTESVSVSLGAGRLCELMGMSELPHVFRQVTESDNNYPLVSRDMTPGLFRLLDEIANADVKGTSRCLWYQAKSLELIALMTDELVETARATKAPLSAGDIGRLERVRLCLVEHLEAPPTLAELARNAGCNETKLKGGFRLLFGTSVFAYLRRMRMEEARRLLLERQLNVTEVAQRVGYANPSKFAAAFRKQFGRAPSTL